MSIIDLGLSDLVAVAGIVIGALIATFFYYKSRKSKKPRFEIKSYNIIRDFEAQTVPLEIRFSGVEVENVTVSKIAFWNAGDETMKGSEVASTDPVTVHLTSGCKILDAKVLAIKNKANKIEIEKQGDSCVVVKFEFIDKDEGAVIQLVHTGKSSRDIRVDGTVWGAGKPKTRVRPLSQRILMMAGLVIVGIIVVAATFTAEFAIQKAVMYPTTVTTTFLNSTITSIAPPSSSSSNLGFLAALLGPCVVSLTFFIGLIALTKYKVERFPKGFSEFQEEIVSESKVRTKEKWKEALKDEPPPDYVSGTNPRV